MSLVAKWSDGVVALTGSFNIPDLQSCGHQKRHSDDCLASCPNLPGETRAVRNSSLPMPKAEITIDPQGFGPCHKVTALEIPVEVNCLAKGLKTAADLYD